MVGLKACGQELGAECSEIFFDFKGFNFDVDGVDWRYPDATCCDVVCGVLDDLYFANGEGISSRKPTGAGFRSKRTRSEI